MTTMNRQARLAARPTGMPKHSDWKFVDEPVPELKDGEVLVKVTHISLDPAMRGWMNEGKSYIRPVAIDEVMRAGGAGRVSASRNPAAFSSNFARSSASLIGFSAEPRLYSSTSVSVRPFASVTVTAPLNRPGPGKAGST